MTAAPVSSQVVSMARSSRESSVRLATIGRASDGFLGVDLGEPRFDDFKRLVELFVHERAGGSLPGLCLGLGFLLGVLAVGLLVLASRR